MSQLEERHVTIGRALTTMTYPADFVLIGSLNPCSYSTTYKRVSPHGIGIEKGPSSASNPGPSEVTVHAASRGGAKGRLALTPSPRGIMATQQVYLS